jgi:hypothetical protein
MNNEWFDAATAASARIAAPAIGVLLGTAAKYGEALKNGTRLTWRGFVGDILLLGIIVELAIAISGTFHLSGNYQVLAGALTGVTSDRLVRLAKAWFLRRFNSILDKLVDG